MERIREEKVSEDEGGNGSVKEERVRCQEMLNRGIEIRERESQEEDLGNGWAKWTIQKRNWGFERVTVGNIYIFEE